MQDVKQKAIALNRLAKEVDHDYFSRVNAALSRIRAKLNGRTVWQINSTAKGGGVAEMLQQLLGYALSAGVDARWAVIEGSQEFFQLTKRLHHALHGMGETVSFHEQERQLYEKVLAENARSFQERLKPGDLVLIHDPQPLGLAPYAVERGATVVWRCHIGAQEHNEHYLGGWEFLEPYLKDVSAFVFSRADYIPAMLDRRRCFVVPPSIDPCAPKNCRLAEDFAPLILTATGLLEGDCANVSIVANDGSRTAISRQANVVRQGRAPTAATPLVVQVSRWDPLKDPIGVMRGFFRYLQDNPLSSTQLLLAGPEVRGVVDDPESMATYELVVREWQSVGEGLRSRVHLACLPMANVRENAFIVNALQRHAAVIIQKSLREGFGLTVAEAMWKARPVIGSAVSGIPDQIEHRVNGILLPDPKSTTGIADALDLLLSDPDLAASLGARAHQKVYAAFLSDRHFSQYLRILAWWDRLFLLSERKSPKSLSLSRQAVKV